MSELINDSAVEIIVTKGKAISPEETALGDSIIQQWNSIATDFENKTIAFVKIVKQHLDLRPCDSVSRVMAYIYHNSTLKRSIDVRKITNGLKIATNRPDLIDYKPGSAVYTRPDGGIQWEFYFLLYKYNLTEEERKAFETRAIAEKWSNRQLKKQVAEFKYGQQQAKLPDLDRKDAYYKEIVLKLVRGLNHDNLKKAMDILSDMLTEQRKVQAECQTKI